MKERLDNPRNLLTHEEQDLPQLWQDKEFLCAFPRMASFLISNEGRMEFSKDERAQIFSDSLEIFLSNNNKRLSGYRFTENGEIITTHNFQGGEKTDSYSKTVIASILLIGMSLLDREMLIGFVIDSQRKLSSAKRGNFIDNLGRLLATNNPTRAYIKDEKLDADNEFDWDTELAHILFFGIYKQVQSARQRLGIPQEMKDTMLKHYSLETLSVILNYALDQVEHLRTLRNSNELTGFIDHTATRLVNAGDDLSRQEMIKGMREKLDDLKETMSYKQSESSIAKR